MLGSLQSRQPVGAAPRARQVGSWGQGSADSGLRCPQEGHSAPLDPHSDVSALEGFCLSLSLFAGRILQKVPFFTAGPHAPEMEMRKCHWLLREE